MPHLTPLQGADNSAQCEFDAGAVREPPYRSLSRSAGFNPQGLTKATYGASITVPEALIGTAYT